MSSSSSSTSTSAGWDSFMDVIDGALDKIKSLFGGGSKFELDGFQKKKLLHEFHMFYDVNKDGQIQWKDLDVARKNICTLNGWKEGSVQYNHVKELFIELWRNLEDTGDANVDGQISEDEWIRMWNKIYRAFKKTGVKSEKESENESIKEAEDPIPKWFYRYIEYKFYLYDRANDGVIDEEEFEYCLNSGFDVPSKQCKAAFSLFSKENKVKVNMEYFKELAMEYYLSNDPQALGNYINGKLTYQD